jgi:hypothetical protein
VSGIPVRHEFTEAAAKALFEAGRAPHRVRHGDREMPSFPWERVPAEPKARYRKQAKAAIAAFCEAEGLTVEKKPPSEPDSRYACDKCGGPMDIRKGLTHCYHCQPVQRLVGPWRTTEEGR